MSARPLFDQATRALPQRLGKYLIDDVLGEGAMGVVYRATDPDIDRVVAIKVIRAPLRGSTAPELNAAQRFRTEAQAAGRLSHPNIVSVYEYGEAGPDVFIVMEHVAGVSLLELMAGGRLALADALSLVVQLLDALACAHAQGVWHRDIKPANLLVTPEGRLKVSDFGIARIASAELTQHGMALGSPGYMAPERYTGEAPDRRVDLFSAGVLLHELLTGQAPFSGNHSELMYQVLHREPPAPSSLAIADAPPARFDAVVARALAKRPADRYESAEQMRTALLEAAGRPVAPNVSIDTMMRPRPASADAADPAATRVVTPRAASVPAWDADWLAAIEGLLLGFIGPVAPLLVRDAARCCTHPAALLARIAGEALDPDERKAFLARAEALPARRRTQGPAVTTELPVLGRTPMAAGLAEKAQAVLAQHIGPIAGLVARHAAARSVSREQFFTALADQAGEDADRRQLLAELWRLG
jgi:serine/threonine-protein kinase